MENERDESAPYGAGEMVRVSEREMEREGRLGEPAGTHLYDQTVHAGSSVEEGGEVRCRQFPG